MRVMSDDRCRVQSSTFIKPNTPYDFSPAPDGGLRVVELVPKEPPLVRPRRVSGKLRGARLILDRAAVAAAIRAERDER